VHNSFFAQAALIARVGSARSRAVVAAAGSVLLFCVAGCGSHQQAQSNNNDVMSTAPPTNLPPVVVAPPQEPSNLTQEQKDHIAMQLQAEQQQVNAARQRAFDMAAAARTAMAAKK
jgi:hypothetical protein